MSRLLVFHELDDFRHDVVQVVIGPVFTEAQMTAGQRAFDDAVIRHTVYTLTAAQENLQRTHARHDDADLHLMEARVIFNQFECAVVQTSRQRNAVNAGIKTGLESRAERIGRSTHRELLHHVNEETAVTLLALDCGFHDTQCRVVQLVEVELDLRLVLAVAVELVTPGFRLREMGVHATI